MTGVAQLKAGPTQEQQDHARVLRERLLADLQQQVTPCRPCNTGKPTLVKGISDSVPLLSALRAATGTQDCHVPPSNKSNSQTINQKISNN